MPRFSTKKPFQQEIYSRHIGEIKTLLHALELRDAVIEGENRPLMDMYETDHAFMLEFDLPGFDLADISLTIHGSTLVLDARRHYRQEEESPRFICLERGHGIFHHAIVLPGNFNSARVSAEYRRGVLRVTCPKQADHKVPIKEIID
jgi:HSP20 family protein